MSTDPLQLPQPLPATAAVPTATPLSGPLATAQPVSVPQSVQEARAVMARVRKIMRRLGFVFGGGAIIGVGFIEPITFVSSLSALTVLGLAYYRFPPSRKVRRARAALRGWEQLEALRGPQSQSALPTGPDAAADPRLEATDAVLARIAMHSGADLRPPQFGREVRQQLARVLEDTRAVELLRQAHGSAPSGEAATRLAAVRGQLDDRIERLVGALAEVYQAVLAHDDATLDAVLARGEEALRQLRAREEVEKLLRR